MQVNLLKYKTGLFRVSIIDATQIHRSEFKHDIFDIYFCDLIYEISKCMYIATVPAIATDVLSHICIHRSCFYTCKQLIYMSHSSLNPLEIP